MPHLGDIPEGRKHCWVHSEDPQLPFEILPILLAEGALVLVGANRGQSCKRLRKPQLRQSKQCVCCLWNFPSNWPANVKYKHRNVSICECDELDLEKAYKTRIYYTEVLPAKIGSDTAENEPSKVTFWYLLILFWHPSDTNVGVCIFSDCSDFMQQAATLRLPQLSVFLNTRFEKPC